jgi:hypothetical protein
VEGSGSRWTDVVSYGNDAPDFLKYKLALFATAQNVMAKIAEF